MTDIRRLLAMLNDEVRQHVPDPDAPRFRIAVEGVDDTTPTGPDDKVIVVKFVSPGPTPNQGADDTLGDAPETPQEAHGEEISESSPDHAHPAPAERDYSAYMHRPDPRESDDDKLTGAGIQSRQNKSTGVGIQSRQNTPARPTQPEDDAVDWSEVRGRKMNHGGEVTGRRRRADDDFTKPLKYR